MMKFPFSFRELNLKGLFSSMHAILVSALLLLEMLLKPLPDLAN